MDVAKYPSVWCYVDKRMDGSQISEIRKTVYEDAFSLPSPVHREDCHPSSPVETMEKVILRKDKGSLSSWVISDTEPK